MNAPILVLCYLVAAAHLFACISYQERARILTKPLLLPALLVLYLVNVSNPAPLVCTAIFLSFLGDVLLMIKGTGWFIAGASAFLLSWTTYTVEMVRTSMRWPAAWLIPIIFGTYYALGILAFLSLRKKMGKTIIPGSIYFLVLSTMGAFSATYLSGTLAWTALMMTIGAILIMISDYLLAYSIFDRRFKQQDFWIMLTYIAGEFLIVYSFIY